MIRIYKDAPTKVELLKTAKLIEKELPELSPALQETYKKAYEAIKTDKLTVAAKLFKQIGVAGKAGNPAKIAKTRMFAKAFAERVKQYGVEHPKKEVESENKEFLTENEVFNIIVDNCEKEIAKQRPLIEAVITQNPYKKEEFLKKMQSKLDKFRKEQPETVVLQNKRKIPKEQLDSYAISMKKAVSKIKHRVAEWCVLFYNGVEGEINAIQSSPETDTKKSELFDTIKKYLKRISELTKTHAVKLEALEKELNKEIISGEDKAYKTIRDIIKKANSERGKGVNELTKLNAAITKVFVDFKVKYPKIKLDSLENYEQAELKVRTNNYGDVVRKLNGMAKVVSLLNSKQLNHVLPTIKEIFGYYYSLSVKLSELRTYIDRCEEDNIERNKNWDVKIQREAKLLSQKIGVAAQTVFETLQRKKSVYSIDPTVNFILKNMISGKFNPEAQDGEAFSQTLNLLKSLLNDDKVLKPLILLSSDALDFAADYSQYLESLEE